MNDSAQQSVSQSIGERLEAARQLAGVSATVAAERLHLDPSVIEALEADRYEALGAPVYVRGHLRRYAEFLGLSPDALVAEYQGSHSRSAAPDLTRIAQADRPSDPRKLLGPSIAAVAAVVLGVAAWWVLQIAEKRDAAPPVIETPKPLPPVMVPAEESPATAAPASNETVPTTAAPSAAVPDAARLTAAPMPPTPATTNTRTATQPVPPVARTTRDVTVQLRFPTDSWVEVYDARGRKLFYDVATGGSAPTVRGRGPLRVVLGNAQGVAVAVDGREAAIPRGAVRGEEARFVVTESGSLVRSR